MIFELLIAYIVVATLAATGNLVALIVGYRLLLGEWPWEDITP